MMQNPDPNDGLAEMDCETLLDLLRVRSRAARAINEQIEAINQQQYGLQQERDAAQEAVRAVLRHLEARAAE